MWSPSSKQHATSVFSLVNPQGAISLMKERQPNEMKTFGEKLIEVANVSYLGYCKLNSAELSKCVMDYFLITLYLYTEFFIKDRGKH